MCTAPICLGCCCQTRWRRQTAVELPDCMVITTTTPCVPCSRVQPGAIVDSPTTFAVVGEAVFSRLRKSGLRLLDRRYDVEVPARRATWPLQQMGPHRGALHPRCSLRCARGIRGRRTDKHKCPVEGCLLCGQRPGMRSQLPGPTHGAAEPVSEEKGGQAGRQKAEVAVSTATPQGGCSSALPTRQSASAVCDCGRGDGCRAANPAAGRGWRDGIECPEGSRDWTIVETLHLGSNSLG